MAVVDNAGVHSHGETCLRPHVIRVAMPSTPVIFEIDYAFIS